MLASGGLGLQVEALPGRAGATELPFEVTTIAVDRVIVIYFKEATVKPEH